MNFNRYQATVQFGNGYNYKDLVQTCSFYAIEGISSLKYGIEKFMFNEYQEEFNTCLDWKEILKLYNKTLEDLKVDVVKYFREFKKWKKTVDLINKKWYNVFNS